MRWRIMTITLGMLLLGACQQRLAAEPALLDQVDASVKLQITNFVLTIAGGTDVVLADNILTEQPEFYIQQHILSDQKGRPLDGRHRLPAYHFLLVKVGSECRLQHPASRDYVVLQGATCQPLSQVN